MTMDPFSLIPASQDAPQDLFPAGSRYRGLPILITHDARGQEIVYVGRRWIPQPASFADVGRYQVRDGDRIDNIAADLMGDPSIYWRIADANAAIAPGELTVRLGRWLRITMPAGIAGPQTV
jgi:hypothetical protein